MNKLLNLGLGKVTVSLNLVHDPVRHSLLAHLPVVDLLLHGVIGDEPVDVAGLLLSIAVHAAHSLGVVARIPRRVQDNHSVGADQVDAQTPGPCRQQEQPGLVVWLVEGVDEPLALDATRAAVKAVIVLVLGPFFICVWHARLLKVLLDEIEGEKGLAEEEDLVAGED